jgi:SAM-dependent methyltransferase
MRWMHLIASGGTVLDVACGEGRHARALAARGYRVWAVDRDSSALSGLAGVRGVTTLCADLEGGPWPYAGRSFAGIIVTNYLHRPLMAHLLDALGIQAIDLRDLRSRQ